MNPVQLIIPIVMILGFAAFFTFIERKVPWLRAKGAAPGNVWVRFLVNVAAACVGYAVYLYFLN